MEESTLTVLIIEDEPEIRRLVQHALLGDPASMPIAIDDTGDPSTVRILEASSGREGLDLAAAEAPALVILDLGLPDMDGLDVCRDLRQWSAASVIVLSARHDDSEKASLLDAGADDYVTKPFSTVEFLARVRAQLRRRRAVADPPSFTITFGDIVVDRRLRRVERTGSPIHLTRTEWSLLRVLMAHPRRTLTHRQLFREVWGNSSGDAQQYLRVYVGHLRRKIERDPVRPQFIHTAAGVGYRFEPDGDGE